jgi:phosphoesterase RecJ-like protein
MIINTLQQISEKLRAEDNFVLVGHAIPDGDCIGSLVGLYLGLRSIGKNCAMYLADPVPPIYRYLNGTEQIQPLKETVIARTVVYLDCSDAMRVGENAVNYIAQPQVTINIDHHYTNELFAHYNLVDAQAAATAEIIFNLLDNMGIRIDKDIANALYAGIVMDTGKFSYSNTTGQTLRTAAALLETGLDKDAVRINLFESRPRAEIQLLSAALQSLAFSDDGRIAWMTLSYPQMCELDALEVYPEDIINYTRMIQGVEVGLLFREISPGVIKIGFRSKHKVDVAAIAAKWGGGGHKQAAGARTSGTLEDVQRLVISSVRDVLE